MESNGGNESDLSTNGYTLTETSGTIPTTSGKIGNARDFEAGDTEYLAIANASCANLKITGEITISAWIKQESQSATQIILSKFKEANGSRSYYLVVTSSNIIRFLVSSDGTAQTYADSTDTISTGTWTHIAATLNQATDLLQVYINGSANGDAVSFTSNIYDNAIDFMIGAYLNSSSVPTFHFDGLIDEVIVWNTALTAGEVSQVYAITTEAQYRHNAAFLLNMVR